jgi:hypothetical protein
MLLNSYSMFSSTKGCTFFLKLFEPDGVIYKLANNGLKMLQLQLCAEVLRKL